MGRAHIRYPGPTYLFKSCINDPDYLSRASERTVHFFEGWSSKGLGLWTILSSLRPKKKKSLQADCNTVSICSSRIVRCFISSSHLWRGRNMFHFMRTWSQTTALRSPKKKNKQKDTSYWILMHVQNHHS